MLTGSVERCKRLIHNRNSKHICNRFEQTISNTKSNGIHSIAFIFRSNDGFVKDIYNII
jgi:hypothetical protein